MSIGVAPNEEKEVDFEKYCKLCKYEKSNPYLEDNPCSHCLDYPTNQFTSKPVDFKEK